MIGRAAFSIGEGVAVIGSGFILSWIYTGFTPNTSIHWAIGVGLTAAVAIWRFLHF